MNGDWNPTNFSRNIRKGSTYKMSGLAAVHECWCTAAFYYDFIGRKVGELGLYFMKMKVYRKSYAAITRFYKTKYLNNKRML